MHIICDIDGTLADCEHRRHWVTHKPKNWGAFNRGASKDALIEPVAETVNALYSHGNSILLCSGREATMREATIEWLIKHDIKYDDLYMRPVKDYRPDDVVKSELLDKMLANGWRPKLVIDDRLSVIQMWKSRGLLVLAVNGGADF